MLFHKKHFHELGSWWRVFKLPDLVCDHKIAGEEKRLNRVLEMLSSQGRTVTSDAVYFYASGLLNGSDLEGCQEGQMDIVVECGPGPTLQFPSAFGKDMPHDTLASFPQNTCMRSQSTVQPMSPISAKGPEELWNPTVGVANLGICVGPW